MTNAQIIFNQSIKLMNDGIIGTTGRKITIQYEKEGEQVTEIVDEPEPIHTFQEWKNNGFMVKKGEKAIARFTIWNYAKGKTTKLSKEDADRINSIAEGIDAKEGDETTSSGHYYMKEACFFKASQVAAIEKKTA